MSAEISYNAFVQVNGVNLSNRCAATRINRATDSIDVTASGDRAHATLAGLENAGLAARFIQDLADGSVDATLFPLIGSSGFTVVYRKDGTAAVGPTNPSYTFTAVLEGYNPGPFTQGQKTDVSVTFRAAGAVTRAEA